MCPRKHIRKVACQLYLTGFCPLGPECPRGQLSIRLLSRSDLLLNIFSPNPNIPSPNAYGPPLPPSAKDLGPPPPGYGRYVDLERGNGVGPPGSNSTMSGPPRRNLDEVLCFKVSPLML